jgi:hypothetical protein
MGEVKQRRFKKNIKVGKKKRRKLIESILSGNDNKPRGFQNSAKNLTGEYESPPGKFNITDVVKKTDRINYYKKKLKK